MVNALKTKMADVIYLSEPAVGRKPYPEQLAFLMFPLAGDYVRLLVTRYATPEETVMFRVISRYVYAVDPGEPLYGPLLCLVLAECRDCGKEFELNPGGILPVSSDQSDNQGGDA